MLHNNQHETKAIICARVSTKDQEDGHSLEAQIQFCYKYAIEGNFSVICEPFRIIESARKEKRPEFAKMVDFIKKQKGKIIVLVYNTDRLQRDFDEQALILDKFVKEDKVEIHYTSTKQIINSKSDSGTKFRQGLEVLLARDYSNRVSDNVKRSNCKKHNEGTISRDSPIGYINKPRINQDKEPPIVEIDHERAPYIIKCFEWYASGKCASMEDIRIRITKEGLRTKKGNKISKSQIESMLQNKFYCGYMKINGVLYSHVYPKLISEELFEACQDIRLGRRRMRTKMTRIPFVFSGLLKCYHCNCAYSPEHGHKKLKDGGVNEYVYLRPTKSQGECNHCKHMNENRVLPQVQDMLAKIQIPEEMLKEIHAELKQSVLREEREQRGQLEKLQAQYSKIDEDIKKVRRKYVVEEKITKEEYDEMVYDLQSEKHTIENKLKEFSDHDDTFGETIAIMFELVSKAHEIFKSSGTDKKRCILQILFPNLQMDGEKLVFTYRKPLDMFFNLEERPVWLPRVDGFRTYSSDIVQSISRPRILIAA